MLLVAVSEEDKRQWINMFVAWQQEHLAEVLEEKFHLSDGEDESPVRLPMSHANRTFDSISFYAIYFIVLFFVRVLHVILFQPTGID